jgi:hypothetical protein
MGIEALYARRRKKTHTRKGGKWLRLRLPDCSPNLAPAALPYDGSYEPD